MVARILKARLRQLAGKFPIVTVTGPRQSGKRPARKRLKLPLIECAHEARPGEEMIPERAAEVLLEEEARMHRGALR